MKFVRGMAFLALCWARQFMDGCTHAGVAKGTNCPLCGRLV